jgi:hypothetical protein
MGKTTPVSFLPGPVPVPALCADTDCPVWREFTGLRDRHDLLLRTLRWVSVICVGTGAVVWLVREDED